MEEKYFWLLKKSVSRWGRFFFMYSVISIKDMAKQKIKIPRKLVREYRDTETKKMYCIQEASAAKFLGNKSQEQQYNRQIPPLERKMEALWKEIDREVGGGLESIKMLFVVVNGKKKFG